MKALNFLAEIDKYLTVYKKVRLQKACTFTPSTLN